MTEIPPKMKLFKLWLYAYQTKARNPGNTVVATNPVFDLLMISNDLLCPPQTKYISTMAFMQIKRKLGTQGIQ